MTRFKVGDEVYVKFTVKRVDDSSFPYSLENNGVFVWALEDESIISADRVEIKEETFKFGEMVQVRKNIEGEWRDAIYVKKDMVYHGVITEDSENVSFWVCCRRKQ